MKLGGGASAALPSAARTSGQHFDSSAHLVVKVKTFVALSPERIA
jgi:hypothetical protein